MKKAYCKLSLPPDCGVHRPCFLKAAHRRRTQPPMQGVPCAARWRDFLRLFLFSQPKKPCLSYPKTGIISLVPGCAPCVLQLVLLQHLTRSSMSVAAVLLYTSPSCHPYVALFFPGGRHPVKVIALAVTFAAAYWSPGCSPGQQTISLRCFLFGLGLRLRLRLYSIFGKFVLDKYSPATVTYLHHPVLRPLSLPVSGLHTNLFRFGGLARLGGGAGGGGAVLRPALSPVHHRPEGG